MELDLNHDLHSLCRLFTGKLRNTSRSVTLKKVHNFPDS